MPVHESNLTEIKFTLPQCAVCPSLKLSIDRPCLYMVYELRAGRILAPSSTVLSPSVFQVYTLYIVVLYSEELLFL